MDASIQLVELRKTPSGSVGIWVEFDVDEEEWNRLGHIGGFSVAVIEPVQDDQPVVDLGKPELKLVVDAGLLDAETFKRVREELSVHFRVSGGLLYQFSIIPPVKVIIEISVATLVSLPAGVLEQLSI